MEVLCLIFTMYNLGGGNSFKINSLANRAISTFFAVIFFFALGAIVDSREATGHPCESPYMITSVGFTYGPCNYTASVCFLCDDEEGNHSARIWNIYAEYWCYQIPNDPEQWMEFMEALHDAVTVEIARLCNTPNCVLAPFKRKITITSPLCRRIKNIPPIPPDPSGSTELITCEGPLCVTEREFCYWYDTTPPTLHVISQTKTLIGTGSCEMTWEEYMLYYVMDPMTPWTTGCIQLINCE